MPAPIAWKPCQEDQTAECGTLTVPVDWAQPNETIDVAVARRKAGDPTARIGALVVNPGGPGGSGVDTVLLNADTFPSEVTRRFDLVGFDPRGVRRSHPIVCSANLLARRPSPMATEEAAFQRLVAYNHKVMADCRARTGALFDHVDTRSVVQDLDALRVAMGEAKLNFLGVSYGTLIGQQYAEMFGDRMRAAVIDSNMDHSLGIGDFLRTEAMATQDSFEQFATWCAGTDFCPLHDLGVKPATAKLRAFADAGKLAMYDFPETFTLMQLVHNGLAAPAWRDLAQIMLNLLDAVAIDQGSADGNGPAEGLHGAGTNGVGVTAGGLHGAGTQGVGVTAGVSAGTGTPPRKATAKDFAADGTPATAGNSWLAARMAALRAEPSWSATDPAARRGTFTVKPMAATATTSVALSAYAAPIFCEDWLFPVYSGRQLGYYIDQVHALAPDVLPALAISMVAACAGWAGPLNNPQRRLTVSTGPGMLLLNGLHDPATPYVWALSASSQLGQRGRLVTYEGSGHGVYFRTECTKAATAAYLIDLTVPKWGAKCAAQQEDSE